LFSLLKAVKYQYSIIKIEVRGTVVVNELIFHIDVFMWIYI